MVLGVWSWGCQLARRLRYGYAGPRRKGGWVISESIIRSCSWGHVDATGHRSQRIITFMKHSVTMTLHKNNRAILMLHIRSVLLQRDIVLPPVANLEVCWHAKPNSSSTP